MSDEFEKCIDFDNLYKGMKASCRGVRWKESVIRYENNGLKNTHNLKKDMEAGKYQIQKYQTFEIFEPKRRVIVATRIRDRQLQHSIVDNCVYQELTKSFVADNCACQKGRGTDYCMNRMRKHLRQYFKENGQSNEGYYLKCDIQNYFGSIDHEIVSQALRKYIHDDQILIEMDRIINSFEGDAGLGLGSQCNQLFALALLNGLDHFIKEKLRIRFYIRYMDDFILIHSSKEYLKECKKQIEDYLERLRLRLHKKKTIIQPIRHGIKLLKWRFILTDTGRTIVLMDRRKVAKQKRKITKLMEMEKTGRVEPGTCDNSMRCWMANAKRGDSFEERSKMSRFYVALTEGEKHIHDYVKFRGTHQQTRGDRLPGPDIPGRSLSERGIPGQ